MILTVIEQLKFLNFEQNVDVHFCLTPTLAYVFYVGPLIYSVMEFKKLATVTQTPVQLCK